MEFSIPFQLTGLQLLNYHYENGSCDPSDDQEREACRSHVPERDSVLLDKLWRP